MATDKAGERKHGLGRAKFRIGQVVRLPIPAWVRITRVHKPHLYLGKWFRDYTISGLDDPIATYCETDMRPLTKKEFGR